jgi:molybdopterin converting factor small subunit
LARGRAGEGADPERAAVVHARAAEAVGRTLDALFADLDHRYPGLRFRVVDEQNMLRPNMRIFVNGLGVRDLQHALRPDDFVAIVLALSGG